MFNSSMPTKELLTILAFETLRKFDQVCYFQQLIREVAIRHRFEEADQEDIRELMQAATSVPKEYIEAAQNKCITLLKQLTGKGNQENSDEEDMEVESTVQKKNRVRKLQNGRKYSFARNRKLHRKETAKKSAYASSQKFNKSQTNQSGRKYFRQFPSSSKTSDSDSEEAQAIKLPRRRKLKKKAAVERQSRFDDDREDTSADETDSTEKMLSNFDSTYNSIKEVELKASVVRLTDFMTDPSADNDEYIAQYKQSFGYKSDKENEYVILDEADHDVDFDERAESDHNSDNDHNDDDNEKDELSTKSHDNNTEEQTTASKEPSSELPKNMASSGKSNNEVVSEQSAFKLTWKTYHFSENLPVGHKVLTKEFSFAKASWVLKMWPYHSEHGNKRTGCVVLERLRSDIQEEHDVSIKICLFCPGKKNVDESFIFNSSHTQKEVLHFTYNTGCLWKVNFTVEMKINTVPNQQ